MKRKYRVTPRGRVVFTSAGILVLVLLIMLIQSLRPDQITQVDVPEDPVLNEQQNTANDQISTESNDDADESMDEASDEPEDKSQQGAEIDTSQKADNCNYQGDGDMATEEVQSSVDESAAERLYNAKTTVYFEPDKYDLKDEYRLVLNIFIGVAKDHPNEKIKVEGNINGYPKFNDSKFGEELSQIRASKVAQYLMNMGIPEDMIIVQSNGSSKPLNKSDSSEELLLNRRTDVYFENYLIEDEMNKK